MLRSSLDATRSGMAALFLLAQGLLLSAPVLHAAEPDPALVFDGAAGFDKLGSSVAAGLDLNADNHLDFVFGAPTNDAGGADAGRVYVHFGGPGRDDAADLILTGAAGEQLGGSLAAAGDVNGDGYDDLLVGAHVHAGSLGRVYVFFGGPALDGVADWVLTGETAGDSFGWSVSGIGDVDDDGFDDVAVGAPGYDATQANAGRVYVFFGAALPDAVADLEITGDTVNGSLGWAVCAAGDVDGDAYPDFVVGAPNENRAYVLLGGPALDAVADLTLSGEVASDSFGTSVAGGDDLDGDGFDDIVIGARRNDAGGLNAGRVYFFRGGAALDATPDAIVTGGDSGESLGVVTAMGGDLNGDGFGDVLIGANRNPALGSQTGRTYVVLGSSSLIGDVALFVTGEAASDMFGSAIAFAGDTNADGYPEFLVGATQNDGGATDAGRGYLYDGLNQPPLFDVQTPAGESWVIGTIHTVTWSGSEDASVSYSLDGGATWTQFVNGGLVTTGTLTVAAPDQGSMQAVIGVHRTGQPMSDLTGDRSVAFEVIEPDPGPSAAALSLGGWSSLSEGSRFGTSVACAGDVNGDGFDDVVVGAPHFSEVAIDQGRAYLYLGGDPADDIPDLVLDGEMADARFGESVAGVGDFNDDGYPDFVVGSPDYGSLLGRAYLYLGGPTLDAVPDGVFQGFVAGENLGLSVAGAGDMNGDGYVDIIIGAPEGTIGARGRVYIYLGGTVVNTLPDYTVVGPASFTSFGIRVSGVGDVNGDGRDDFAVTAFPTSAGEVHLYFGTDQLTMTPDRTYLPEGFLDRFGIGLAGPADVNGDGFDDLVIGASQVGSGDNGGKVHVFLGGSDPDTIADLTVFDPAAIGTGNALGSSVASLGDVNQDGYDDFAAGAPGNDLAGNGAGMVRVYFGNATLDGVPDLVLTGVSPSSAFGNAVGSAGDFTGDGMPDLLVGAYIEDIGGTNNAGSARVYDYNRYHLTDPAGGEAFEAGESIQVSWLGEELADLALSFDDGQVWYTMVTGVGGQASNGLSLDLPSVATVVARVRLTPSDGAVSGEDVSDTFLINGDALTHAPEALTILEGLGVPYPNPADRGVAALFPVSVRDPATIQLILYDVRGRKVAETKPQRIEQAGHHVIGWRPRGVASGAYFVVATRDGERLGVRRWTLLD